jgi:hypothetical protein
MPRLDPAWIATAAVAGYHLVQNLTLPDRAYVPANLAVTAGLVALGSRSGLTPAEMGLDPRDLPAGLARGAIAGGVVAAGAAAFSAIRPTHPVLIDERAGGHGRGEAAYRTLARFPLGTALFEEVAFRGVLHGLWRRRLGSSGAEAATAVAFGAWHLLPTYRAFLGSAVGSGSGRRRALAAAGGGALLTAISSPAFGYLRDRTGSIATPWLAHAAFNVSGYLAARRAWRRLGPEGVTA